MSESPEVEPSTQNPRGKTNIEQGPEPLVDKTDPTEPVRVSNLKQTPSGNLETQGRWTQHQKRLILPFPIFCSYPPEK
jgi:hypothetical protein